MDWDKNTLSRIATVTLLALFTGTVYFAGYADASISDNFCESSIQYNIFKTNCINCWQNRKVRCPRGAKKLTRLAGTRGCRYEIPVGAKTQTARGCTHTCREEISTTRCCEGYWGQDCQSCPKDPSGVVCGGRGHCFDGYTGNGTCQCDENLAGSYCEVCTKPQFYGPTCRSVCACGHGTCDNGINGTGACFCEDGYGGRQCNQALAACSSLSCHDNATCQSVGQGVGCVCSKGYTGNGISCIGINPCLAAGNALCMENATCLHTGPGQSTCKCKQGFSGDGNWCQVDDPCQTNSGGCNSTSSICKFDGPGQFHCQCKNGFADQNGLQCQLVDICGKYESSTCGENAACQTILIGEIITIKCTCPPGLLEFNKQCYDDLLFELGKLNSTGPFANQLNFALTMFKVTYERLLFNPNLWTLFAPVDTAFPPELQNITSDLIWKARARAHVVSGSIYVDFNDSSAKTMYPLLGHDYPIGLLRPGVIPDSGSDAIENYFADMKFQRKLRGKVLTDAKPALNGMIYIIDTVLGNDELKNFSSNSGTVDTMRKYESLSNFTNLLSKSYSFQRKLAIVPKYTIYAPTNEAMAELSEDEMSYLTSPMGRSALEDLLLYSLVLTGEQSVFNLVTTPILYSIENIIVNVSEVDGTVTLGSSQAQIMKSDITIQGRQIYISIIDKILIPESIKPLVKNQCEQSTERQVRGPCGECSQLTCPPGGKPLTRFRDVKQCVYNTLDDSLPGSRRLFPKMGCHQLCSTTVVTTVCCSGFYGSECRSCPGPTLNACSGNGICSDGIGGTGLCNCNEAFTGAACDKCRNQTKYGSRCSQDCNCLHGTCSNTINSRGECMPGSCQVGWSGENCDRAVVLCASGALTCHQFATCVVDDQGNSSCVCDAGYTGSGDVCTPFNPCENLQSSGCSINAYCLNIGGGNVSCQCLPYFSGDGYSCTPIDNCASTDRGGCSDDALCIFTGPGKHQCECKVGYRGNGRLCSEINVCEENNGGCDIRARCKKTGPGTRSCTCFAGYEAIGESCVGNILQEIASRSELSQIHSWITNTRPIKSLLMNLPEGFTCFLPTDSAWTFLSFKDQDFWLTDEHIPYVLKNHIVQTYLPTSELKKYEGKSFASMLVTVNIDINTVTVGTSDLNVGTNKTELSNLPTIGKNLNAKLIVSDIPVSRKGVIHIIDTVIIPPRDVVTDYPALSAIISNSLGSGLENYGMFIGYLNSTGALSTLVNNNSPFTLFLASDTALTQANISADQMANVVNYHIIPSKLMRGIDVRSGEHLTTSAGSGYLVTLVRKHDSLLVNGLTVLKIANRTNKGIIYRLTDQVLQPQKTRCDRTTSSPIQTRCLPCYYPSSCPAHSKLVMTTQCLFLHETPHSGYKTSQGCSLKCTVETTQPKCCEGFYGDGCDPCPGGIGNVCFGLGKCSDGMKGTGVCTCSDPKYAGAACETCAEGRYGSNCDQVCQCKYGVCNDGMDGDGTCTCSHGYRGVDCGNKIVRNDSCGSTCHTAANCVPAKVGSGSVCICSAGYKGNGTHCQSINPCTDPTIDPQCHNYATCVFVSAGKHNCSCIKNYEGDGRYCSPVNPCLKSYGEKCDQNADCFMTSPNVSRCVCRDYFEGDGKSCRQINVCEKDNGGCSENAICKLGDIPGERVCNCKADYIGDGVRCMGSIYSHISGQPKFTWFTLMDAFASLVPHVLNEGNPLVVFLPSQTIMMNLNSDWLNYEEPATQLYLNHIVGCFESRNLTGVSKVRTMAGDVLTIVQNASGIFINNKIKVLGGPMGFWNGILYEIDGPLIPASISRVVNKSRDATKIVKILQPYLANASDSSDPLYKNTKILLDNGFQWVVTLLQTAGGLTTLQHPVHNPWTLLLPNEDAFHLQNPQRLRSFMNTDDPTFASEYINYHMIREAFLDPIDVLVSDPVNSDLRTMQGSKIAVQCDSSSNIYGQLTVNNGMAKIIGFDVFYFTTQTGDRKKAAIYIIDKVLDPPSIGGRCDKEENSETSTPCTLCLSTTLKCPGNTTLVKRGECSLPIPSTGSGLPVTVPGCQVTCTSYKKIHRCCPHYFADTCQACPGGPGSPCNGNGRCNDGVNGTGTCQCKAGFIGRACDRCDTGRYGRNCVPCQCATHGHCNEGITRDGTCFCDRGWSGPKCDENVSGTTLCDSPCHRNGYCLNSGTCRCKPGFKGDGRNECVFMNMCRVNNGGCSPYGICEIHQKSINCKCRPNFMGDGYTCDPIDPCTSVTNTCHSLARCIVGPSTNSSKCVCKPGFVGDGTHSCVKREAKTCSLNNGGCSGQAICTDIPPSGPGALPTTSCKCSNGYIGDGITCLGTVADVIRESFEMRSFYVQLRKQPLRLRRRLGNAAINFTIFVPARVVASRKPTYAIKRHIVQGEKYYFDDLKKLRAVRMASGDNLPVRATSSNNVHINGVRIRRSDIVATNGVIHVVDTFIPAKINANPTTLSTSTSSSTTLKSTTTKKTVTPSKSPATTTPPHKTKPPRNKSPKTKSPSATVAPKPNDKDVTSAGPAISQSSSMQQNQNPSQTKATGTGTTGVGVASGQSSSSSAKVAIPIVIILIVIAIAVGAVYWWKVKHSGQFSLFRGRSDYDGSEEDSFGGLTNPAYDSTGFNTKDNDDVVLRETDEETALVMKGDEGPISFASLSRS